LSNNHIDNIHTMTSRLENFIYDYTTYNTCTGHPSRVSNGVEYRLYRRYVTMVKKESSKKATSTSTSTKTVLMLVYPYTQGKQRSGGRSWINLVVFLKRLLLNQFSALQHLLDSLVPRHAHRWRPEQCY
jgi:hypothetical protein